MDGRCEAGAGKELFCEAGNKADPRYIKEDTPCHRRGETLFRPQLQQEGSRASVGHEPYLPVHRFP